MTSEICGPVFIWSKKRNAETLEEVLLCLYGNVLWKFADVLIDILWQATFPQCWYKSSADSTVSGPLLYWLSHWSPLWSTEGMKKRKKTSPASQQQSFTHTGAQSVSWLSHLYSSLSTDSQTTQTCQNWDSLLHQGTHAAWSYNTKLYCVAMVTSVLYGQLY